MDCNLCEQGIEHEPVLIEEVRFPPGAFFKWCNDYVALLDNVAILRGTF